MTAKEFTQALEAHIIEAEEEKLRKFFWGDDDTKAMGVKFGTVFKLSKQYKNMSLDEINTLLDSPYYEVRMGAVSIIDYQARDKKTSEAQRKQLYDLYLARHDRLNNWDFVDRAAPHVIGGYLIDKPRDILYDLARSESVWERRTAIVSTYFFIKQGDLEDTFKIATILIHDEHELINKAVGSWLREAGKRDEARLKTFLDHHPSMPRVTLRYAIEKLSNEDKAHYLNR